MISEDQIGTPLEETISKRGMCGCIALMAIVVALIAALVFAVTGGSWLPLTRLRGLCARADN